MVELTEIVLLTGGNLGDRKANLARACFLISEVLGEPVKESGIYESPSWGFEAEKFLNQVLVFKIDKRPEEVLKLALAVEEKMGRERSSKEGYQSRLMDVDILFYGDKVIDQPELRVPHPRMAQRRFVLEPLAEVCSDKIHPELGISVQEMLENCQDGALVLLFAELSEV